MKCIAEAIRDALLTADPVAKIMTTRKVARNWRLGRLAHDFEAAMPDRPARLAVPLLLPPSQMPKRGKAGGKAGGGAKRIALIHALAHIEFSAIDLALDMAGRFGAGQPRGFVDDWLSVAADEAMHFALLDRRLGALGSYYGALPAHDGLWEAAEKTCHDPLARLAIVPLVLEARGLDVSPATIARLEAAGDRVSARIVARIYEDEIRHVATGFRWFSTFCTNQPGGAIDPILTWQKLVKTWFRGPLKPPFNDSARESAGLTRQYYQSLASPGVTSQ
jgi:uncharacterized ferritin-like protein (DUF455 family)